MNRTYLFLVIAIVIAGLAIAIAISLMHDGMSARAQPSALEMAIAHSARRMAAPKSAKNARNPVADSPEVQREARLHFADHCAICHGNDGGGDTLIGRGLYPKAPNLRGAETQQLSDGEIFWIIENGVRLTGMPGFGGNGAEHGGDDASWKLVRFIRHLPNLTTAERLEMEKYNPKGPDDRDEEKDEDNFLNGRAPKPDSDSPHRH